MKVCSECGNSTFTQRRIATIEVTMQVNDDGYPQDGYEEVIDADRDADTLKCEDCFASLGFDDLITEDEYNQQEDE